MATDIEILQSFIDRASSVVFFGGAGVSTESGIPDFRSVDGLYNQKYSYPPEYILSHGFYLSHKKDFYAFYRDKMICPDAKPNSAHLKLAEMERKGKLSAVVTQNIDGLHFDAGSNKVFELHGSVRRYYCEKCHKMHGIDVLKQAGVPKCDCGGDIKPDVVLYEEGLDEGVLYGAIRAIENADLLIIGGTSLSVYPASGLVGYMKKGKVVIINNSPTYFDEYADLVISDKKIGEVFSKIKV